MWLLDEKTRKLSLAAQVGLNPKAIETAKNYNLPKSDTVPDQNIEGVTVWVFVRNRTFFAQNWDMLSEHPSHRGYWDEEQWDKKPNLAFGCLYAAPLRVEDKPIGDFIPARNNLGHFSVYVLRHKDKKFSGFLCGIGFQNGRGSTNSWEDVQKLIHLINPATQQKKNLVTDITEDYWNAKIEARKKADERKASKETKTKKEETENSEGCWGYCNTPGRCSCVFWGL